MRAAPTRARRSSQVSCGLWMVSPSSMIWPTGEPGRQRPVGVLEHHLHLLAQRPHGGGAERVDALAAVGDGTVGGDEPEQGEPQRGLARARLAHHAQCLAGAQLEREAVDRLDVIDSAAEHALLDREPHLEVVGLEHHRGAGRRLRRAALGLGGEQMPCVGVLRALEHLLGPAFLDDLARVHDVDAVGHVAHHAQIVGDEQHRHAALLLQLLEQLQDLRLDGDIERGGGLVGDQQVGLVGERHGDHHPLTLAAGELIGVGVEALLGLGEADLAQQLEHARLHGGLVEAVVQLHDLADLRADGVQRVERGHRLLEDDGDLLAADVAHHGLGRLEQVVLAEADLA